MRDKIVTAIKAISAGVTYGICTYVVKRFTDTDAMRNVRIPIKNHSYPIWSGINYYRGDRVIWKGHVWMCIDFVAWDEPGTNDDEWRMIDEDLLLTDA